MLSYFCCKDKNLNTLSNTVTISDVHISKIIAVLLCFLSAVLGNRYLPVLYCDYTNGGWWDNAKCHHNICHDKKCHSQQNWCSTGSLHGNQLPHTNCLPHAREYYVQELWMALIWCFGTCCECSCCTVFISSWKRLILDKTNIILRYFYLNNKLTPYRRALNKQYWVQTFHNYSNHCQRVYECTKSLPKSFSIMYQVISVIVLFKYFQ